MKVKKSRRFEATVSEDGKTHTLYINECTEHDTNSSVQIKLLKGNKTNSASLKIEMVKVDNLVKIKRPLEDITVKEGQNGHFECELQIVQTLQDIPITIKWTKDGKDVDSNNQGKYELFDTSDTKTRTLGLDIKKCIPASDAGKYCVEFFIDGKTLMKKDGDAEYSFTIPLGKSDARN